MKLICVFLLNFVFFFFPFPACACRANVQRPQPPLTNSQTHFLQLSTDTPESEILAKSEFWDTQNVDISDVNPAYKRISFTFDDSPSSTLENILAVFASFNEANPDCPASATIFFNGYRFDNAAAPTVHMANAMQIELGNHTYSHLNLTQQDETTVRAEIEKTDALLKKFDGKPQHLLRAPFGKINENVKTLATVPWIDWTIDTLDWTGATETAIYDAVWQNKFDGAIVLMHDGYLPTVNAIKRLLPDLKKEGYQVTSVSKMSKANGCPLKNGSVYIRARKQK